MEPESVRTDAVLSLYDLARCHAAIEAIERRAKPVVEIPIVVSVAQLGPLIDDVMRVTKTTETGEIRVHVDYREGVALVAFYRYAWCRDGADLPEKGRRLPAPRAAFVSGLAIRIRP